MRGKNHKIFGNEIGGLKFKWKLYISKKFSKKSFWSEIWVAILEGYDEKWKEKLSKSKEENKIYMDRRRCIQVLLIPGTSIHGVAKKFEIRESILRSPLKKEKANEPLRKSGCK